MITRRYLQLLTGCAVMAAARMAAAQASDVAIGYSGLPAKSSAAAGNGVQLSESVMLHAGVGVEAGYDSNVFYSDTQVKSSPIIRVLPFIEFTNANRNGVVPSGLYYDVDLNATFRQYLSPATDPARPREPNAKISDRLEFLPTASATLETSSGQTVGFGLGETLSRFEDPPYVTVAGASTPDKSIIRYMNVASAQMRWAPGGGRAQATLRYGNTVDVFETSGLTFANSMSHEASLDLSWKWLPKTALFLKLSQGYISYLNTQDPDLNSDQHKNVSYPFHAIAGIRGLVTQKTSVNFYVGYANTFYSNGKNTEGFLGHITANADIQARPTLLTLLGLGYKHDFQNSIVGNFYNMDGVTAWIQQQIGSRVTVSLSAKYEHRVFQFVTASRADDFAQAGAVVDVRPKSWMYTGVGYSLLYNAAGTPEGVNGPVGADYVKQQIFARLGVTY